ncbi:hypothetical protein L1887_14360 [Cichorium endivia]|nr:hypothetical protein L1887_14360 [Cichorium endivia]
MKLSNSMYLERQKSMPNHYSSWFGRDAAAVFSKSDIIRSLRWMMNSPEAKLSFHKVVQSIPKRRVDLLHKELATDVFKFLECLKGSLDNSSHDVQLKEEGRGSEVYTLIVDLLVVSTSNSSLDGVSLNDWVTIISHRINNLILQPKAVYKHLSVNEEITNFIIKGAEETIIFQEQFGISRVWVGRSPTRGVMYRFVHKRK